MTLTNCLDPDQDLRLQRLSADNKVAAGKERVLESVFFINLSLKTIRASFNGPCKSLIFIDFALEPSTWDVSTSHIDEPMYMHLQNLHCSYKQEGIRLWSR